MAADLDTLQDRVSPSAIVERRNRSPATLSRTISWGLGTTTRIRTRPHTCWAARHSTRLVHRLACQPVELDGDPVGGAPSGARPWSLRRSVRAVDQPRMVDTPEPQWPIPVRRFRQACQSSRWQDRAVNSGEQVWVDILTTQEVVAVGLRTILETADSPFPITTRGTQDAEPDVVLYDVIKLQVEDGADLDYWLKDTGSTVIAVVRTLRPDLGARAMAKGVEWAIDLGITADELVRVIQDAIAGNLEESP